MIGKRIESRSSVSWWVILLVVIGLGLGAAGFVTGIHALVSGAILPLALAGSFALLGWQRPFAGTFREGGLEIENGNQTALIPYSNIHNLRVGGKMAEPPGVRKVSGVITIVHAWGVLQIPARLNVPTEEVYRFLIEHIPDRGRREVHAIVADYLARQEREFGADQVVTFCAASHRARGGQTGLRALAIGAAATGIAWLFISSSSFGGPQWQVAGVTCVAIGVVFLLLSAGQKIPAAGGIGEKWQKASLVITPRGMAMVQGHVEGEVSWPELLEATLTLKPRGSTHAGSNLTPGILLRVKGANIVIFDIYDRPLFFIYKRILSAWRQSTGPGGE